SGSRGNYRGFFDGWCGAAWNAGVNAAGGKADWLCVLVENREKTLSVWIEWRQVAHRVVGRDQRC
ncbi:TPA: hypothetical protein ACK3Q4_008731, partial [Burkholderia cepacia]